MGEALRSQIIETVNEPSEWISPIVIIFKQSGDIRICVDMRRANQAIRRENYPENIMKYITPVTLKIHSILQN